jgi:two-component system, OmpR family, sensor kinase
MSLRRRLVVVLLALAAAGLLTAGFGSAKLLRKSLVKQKDEQLALLVSRDVRGGPRGGETNGRGGRSSNPQREPVHIDDVSPTVGGPIGYVVDTFNASGGPVPGGHIPSPADQGGGPVLTTEELIEHSATGARAFTRPAIRRFVEIESIVGALVLAVLGVLAWLLVRASLRPLERMTATASAIADGDLTARVDETDAKTEVGRLGHSFNTMIGRIEAGFAERTKTENRLRRFVGDASHELRTPLTSIRGYSELVRSGVLNDDAGRSMALARIESEAARMGLLVEDLLLLARVDQGRPLAREPFDLSKVVEANVADARACDGDRIWTFVGHAPVLLVGDADRLHQVISNLVTNARSHTPAGTPVEVSVESSGTHAVVTVRDHGPGFPADEADRIFERFARLDEGRARADGGTGLGLAIVRAIVDAHHGEVSAANAPDGGAVFVLRLPIEPPAELGA